MQESSRERFNRRCQRPASDSSEEEKKQPRRNKGCQKSHDLKREKKKGKDKKKPQARPQAVQEVTMGETAFRPPPNLMRAGMSPREYPPSSWELVVYAYVCIDTGMPGSCEYIPGYFYIPALLFTAPFYCSFPCGHIPV